MTYRIVPMTRFHLDQVEAIEQACFPEDPWSWRLFWDALESETSSSLVAEASNGNILGYIVYTCVLDEGGVDNIAVSESARRHGVATALLEAFHRIAREPNLAYLLLEVRPSNIEALSLYKKMGYREAGRRKHYYRSPREDAIIMRLELTPCT